MNDKQAKRLRKKIYGNKDFRDRTYTEIISKKYTFYPGTDKEYSIEQKMTIADKDRRWYQNAKRAYKDMCNNTISTELLEKLQQRGN